MCLYYIILYPIRSVNNNDNNIINKNKIILIIIYCEHGVTNHETLCYIYISDATRITNIYIYTCLPRFGQ